MLACELSMKIGMPMTSSPLTYSLLRQLRVTAFLALLFLFAAATGASAQDYTVTNLGSPGSSIYAINDSGQVAFFDQPHGYFYDGATAHDIGSLGGNYAWPWDMNASGQVIGSSLTAGGSMHAFSWTLAGGMVDLGNFGGDIAEAAAVNVAGQVVGYSITADGDQRAFLWTRAGGMVDLGTLGGNYAEATAINDAGQVTGRSSTAPGSPFHAFLWTQAGGMIDLGILGGDLYSDARDINASGQVVGFSYTPGFILHAFSWTKAGGMVDLGSSFGGDSYAVDVNSAGQVVGSAAGRDGFHAFSWTKAGGMVDLGTVGGTLSGANAVNDAGQVVGASTTSASSTYPYHAFSWTKLGGMVDLNDHIPKAPPGMEIYSATAVSEKGLIGANASTGTVLLRPSSAAPVLGPISANDPAAARFPLSFDANFTDTDTSETHKAVWSWGDGSPTSSGTVSEAGGSGTVSKSHTYFASGIYTVSLTVTDSKGHAATVSRDVVVYDPSAGFVTGGGWILSPPGAYKADESMAGRANFGFVSKYKRGATKPAGNTEFQFQAAKLNFHSENYDWLVVSGARAQYKGTGAINGQGSYKFRLTAIDGQVSGGGGFDRFRIKIWSHDKTTGDDTVVYDNQLNASTIATTGEGTRIRGGSIVIHK